MIDRPAVPGAVIRSLVARVPVYPWAIVHRGDATHRAPATLHSVAAELAGQEGWWGTAPDDAWVPGEFRRPAG